MKKERQNKAQLSMRVDPKIRKAMVEWADARALPLAWVAEQSIKIGWPLFQKQGVAR